MKNSWRVLVRAWMVALSTILIPGSAHAASSYDDYYTSSPNVVLFKDGCSQSVDISYTWDDYIHNSTYGSSFTNARSGGSWGVSYLPHYSMSGGVSTASAVIVYWSESSTMAIDWTNWGYMVTTGMSQGVLMELVNPGNGNPCSVSVTSFGAGFISSNDGSVENYFFHGAISYPTGYEGAQIVSTQPGAKYVAMGDSFASGEGNDPFETGTDINDVNKCHRSSYAYPQWLAQTPSLDLESFSFVACSGATTGDVLYGGIGEGNWNEGSQVDALSVDTEIVTITIGGNDIGFKDFATQCGLGSCDSTMAIYSTTMAMIHNELPAKLEDVLNEISIRTDTAKVFVVGYPYVTPDPGGNGLPYQCSYLDSANGPGLDSLAARDIVAELNDTINDAVAGFVNTSSSASFVFIDPNSSLGGTFDGHDICQGTDSYFHNVTPNDYFGNGYREKIFHPNVDGQHEYYEIVKDAIETN